MKKGKLIVISAPSGSGKTSIVRELLKDEYLNMAFSISATTRAPRPNEKDGYDYYFKSVDEFKHLIKSNAFVEWEEVYANQYYGTLNSEVERLISEGKNVVFDIDVNGGISIKDKFKEKCLSIFIKAPSLNALKKRLEKRKTESQHSLEQRISKSKIELEKAEHFDQVIVNDDLKKAISEATTIIKNFIDN